MKIEINAEQVDQLVRDTILKAGIGKAIEGAVSRAFGNTYDNPIEKELKSYITTVVRKLLETEFKDKVDMAVREAIAAKLTEPIVAKLAEATIDKIVKAADERY